MRVGVRGRGLIAAAQPGNSLRGRSAARGLLHGYGTASFGIGAESTKNSRGKALYARASSARRWCERQSSLASLATTETCLLGAPRGPNVARTGARRTVDRRPSAMVLEGSRKRQPRQQQQRTTKMQRQRRRTSKKQRQRHQQRKKRKQQQQRS